VQVATFVHGDSTDADLDVLALAGIEPAQEDLLGVGFAALVGQ
jgi:hypothetical protein